MAKPLEVVVRYIRTIVDVQATDEQLRSWLDYRSTAARSCCGRASCHLPVRRRVLPGKNPGRNLPEENPGCRALGFLSFRAEFGSTHYRGEAREDPFPQAGCRRGDRPNLPQAAGRGDRESGHFRDDQGRGQVAGRLISSHSDSERAQEEVSVFSAAALLARVKESREEAGLAITAAHALEQN